MTKQSWCSGGWSLTKVQVGAWQHIGTPYILYLFYCKYYINKIIYSCCSSCVLNINVLTSKTIVEKRNIDSPPQYFQQYNRIDAYLLDNDFDKCDSEPSLYIKENDGKILIVVLYVDDLIFTGSDDFFIIDFKQVMKNEFEMTELGLLRYFLGMEVKQIDNDIFISQATYVADILERFKMQNN